MTTPPIPTGSEMGAVLPNLARKSNNNPQGSNNPIAAFPRTQVKTELVQPQIKSEPQVKIEGYGSGPGLGPRPGSGPVPGTNPGHGVQKSSIAPPMATPMATSMSTPVQNKYLKIQPAIAIKPKPVPIAMLPKPTQSYSFDPTPTLKTSIQLNVNTSKKWVLPPRPRPGRKPTCLSISAEDEQCVQSPLVEQPKKFSPKKKLKTTKYDEVSSESKAQIINQLQQQYPNAKRQHSHTTAAQSNSSPSHSIPSAMGSGKSNPTTTANTSTSNGNPNINNKPSVNTDSSVKNLKLYYLSKIKEQELVKNYIEVINKQIKELRFVQNGVITFDALNTNDKKLPQYRSIMQTSTNSQHTLTMSLPRQQQQQQQIPSTNQQPQQTPSTSQQQQQQQQQSSILGLGTSTSSSNAFLTQYEQLERITNLNDLNKFLGYLTKSSSIIHSVTKNYSGSDENLDIQIKNYLDGKKKDNGAGINTHIGVDKRVGSVSNGSHGKLGNNVVGIGRSKEPQSSTFKASTIFTNQMGIPLNPIEELNYDFSDDGINSMMDQPVTIAPDDEQLFTINELDDYILVDKSKPVNSDNNITTPTVTSTSTSASSTATITATHPSSSSQRSILPQAEELTKQAFKKRSGKKSKRFSSCGFCTNDTPCLCLDAEIEIRQLQKKSMK